MTEVCTAYVDLVIKIYRGFQSSGWAEAELVKLQRRIRKFILMTRAVFGPYQVSYMATVKWQALN